MIHDQAPVIVYKTVADFDHNVPVTLNETKDKIVNYPAPSDLFYEGELSLPVRLKQGYLLDRRGIGPNTAFTSYTYEEYSKLEAAPSLQELFDSIIGKEPFESVYNCGTRDAYGELVGDLNRKIKEGFPGCEELTD
jgi:hypothetical protein